MASKRLKGLTIKIGGDTSELLDALADVEKKGKSLSSELGQINRLLKLDPKNTELLAQKQKVLAEAISNTESKLDTLREAEKQAQEQFKQGKISEDQYRALQREIIATEKKLDLYKKAAQETADAVEDVGKASAEAEQEISKIGKKAEETARKGLAAIIEVAAAVVGAIVAMAESSREYRTETGKLNTAFANAGHSAETAKGTYKALQGILGDTDQAVEAANHMAMLCDSEEELTEWTRIATGVYATFGASLPVEGLAEAANETVKVGQVTGPLADALNWAAAEGETFGVVLKEATEENEEWNKAVQEATSAEDYFNLALQECSTEQERQQLITETLTKLYGAAATQYERTNAEVIRANEATEKWNETTARMGEIMEPAITDVKEFGVSLLSDMEEPLKKVSNYVRTKFLPALTKFSGWVKKNIPAITAGVAGLTAVLVAHKVATLATELATKGMTIATLAQAAAQKVLNGVMAANPLGLVLTAVAGVTAALIAYTAATKGAKKPVDVLTTEERELMEAANDAAQAFRDQKKATDDALGDITAEFANTQALADELFTLANASGQVTEKNQDRANFILTTLNEALGTEYQMVDGVIQQYDTLRTTIEQVIQSKLANALLEAANEDYVAAIQQEQDAWNNLVLAEKDYVGQQSVIDEARATADQAWLDYNEALKLYGQEGAKSYGLLWTSAETAWQREKNALAEKETAYNDAQNAYESVYDTIANFEEAQTAALSGNYEKAVDILSRKGETYGTYSATVDEETGKVLATLQKEAVDAGLEAERTKENFEKGVSGYTQEMVREAQLGYGKAMDAYANAYADANGIGDDMGSGLGGGLENRRGFLYHKARSIVAGMISEMKKEAEINSPSKKTEAITEDMGAGAVVGLDKSTEHVERAAKNQAAAILDAYSAQEIAGQNALRNIAEQQTARQMASHLSAATANSGVLDQILDAIKAGQVLLLDGNALVGGTAKRMDSQLGLLRVLSARGAR